MRRPSFQFYPADWLSHPGLRMCSDHAKAIWIDMMCLMHQCDDYGFLKVNGKVPTKDNLARILGRPEGVATAAIQELIEADVCKRDVDGAIYSARMVGDEITRQRRVEGGKKGGNPALSRGKDNQAIDSSGANKVNHGPNLEVNLPSKTKVKQNPTPSSSSSSSSAKKKKDPPTPLPDDLPEWMPRKSLEEFITHRKEIKDPMTPLATQKLIKKIERLRDEGHEPKLLFDRSIENGWKGIFPDDKETKLGGGASAGGFSAADDPVAF